MRERERESDKEVVGNVDEETVFLRERESV
jgi:hypothetical protein